MKHIILQILTLGVILTGRADAQTQDPLPSWNETATKAAIIEFVEKVSSKGSPDFVPPEDRIATFDNDGTLWCEQPIYTQLAFAFDRVKALAPEHPEWKTEQPTRRFLTGTWNRSKATEKRESQRLLRQPTPV